MITHTGCRDCDTANAENVQRRSARPPPPGRRGTQPQALGEKTVSRGTDLHWRRELPTTKNINRWLELVCGGRKKHTHVNTHTQTKAASMNSHVVYSRRHSLPNPPSMKSHRHTAVSDRPIYLTVSPDYFCVRKVLGAHCTAKVVFSLECFNRSLLTVNIYTG